MTADFEVRNEGSIVMLAPISADAKTWVDENLPDDRLTFGGAVAVEPRYIADIVDGIIASGLSVA